MRSPNSAILTALLGLPLASLLCSFTSAAQVLSSSNPTHRTSHIHDVGKACNVNVTRLTPDSNQLQGDCGYLAWCDPTTNTCRANGCRSDDFPFAYNNIDRKIWPPKCGHGQFCPDEFSYCREKSLTGGPCQLSRDDQCVGSASGEAPICLHNVCQLVNATIGSTCMWENTLYTDYVSLSDTYGDIISRDNCMSGLYCDVPTSRCLARKAEGQACSADKECLSTNCLDPTYTSQTPVNNIATGTCGPQVYTQVRGPKLYVYVVVVLGIVIAAVVLCVSLMRLHQKQRVRKNEELRQYWEEQRMLHRKVQLAREEVLLMAQQRSLKGSPAFSMASLPGGSTSQRSSANHVDQMNDALGGHQTQREGSRLVHRPGFHAEDSKASTSQTRLGESAGAHASLSDSSTPVQAETAAFMSDGRDSKDHEELLMSTTVSRDPLERRNDGADPLRPTSSASGVSFASSAVPRNSSRETFRSAYDGGFTDTRPPSQAQLHHSDGEGEPTATSSAIDVLDPSTSSSIPRNRAAAASLSDRGTGASNGPSSDANGKVVYNLF